MPAGIPGPLIAKGRTAEVYAWNDDQVLKLFYAWCPTRWVQEEVETSRAVSATTLPTPRFIDSLEIGERQGIIFERVEGPSMLQLLKTKPWLVLRLARQLAELHSQIHEQDGLGLPPLRSSLQTTIQQVEHLPRSLKARVLQLLETLPDGNALCHLDFHPDQVLMTAGGPVIIDWMTALQGHPLADVARTSVILAVGRAPYAGWAMRAVIHLWRGLFYRTYVTRYLELNPGVTQDEIRTWMIPIAAGRLKEQIPGERGLLHGLIRSYLSM
jgi:aminoglycoside phosphotransferase (APT) family kinase protein